MSFPSTSCHFTSGFVENVKVGKSDNGLEVQRSLTHACFFESQKTRERAGYRVQPSNLKHFVFGASALAADVYWDFHSLEVSPTESSGSSSSKPENAENPESEITLVPDKLDVLCLSSDTGGGHRASAQALEDCFVTLYGDKFSFNTVDLWSSHSPWPFYNMPKSYFFLVKHPWLWRLNFRCSEPEFVHEFMFTGYAAIVDRRFRQAFSEYRPQLIVSVHPLMQHVPLKVLARVRALNKSKHIPFATVVTDLTRCHATWFHKAVDMCFVATDLVAQQAMRRGLKTSQITCHGLPIRPAFSWVNQVNKPELRRKLGLDTLASTVMLIGGGEGMGKIAETAEALSSRLSSEDQLIVICGRNITLAKNLSSRKWNVKISIKGFVNNMAEYMACCDCVITKAGPGTIAEALTCGLPIVLNGCIPCQEEGNIPYVLQNGVGEYSENPDKIAEIISEWFGPQKDKLREMSKLAKKLGRPEATFDIVRSLADMARSFA